MVTECETGVSESRDGNSDTPVVSADRSDTWPAGRPWAIDARDPRHRDCPDRRPTAATTAAGAVGDLCTLGSEVTEFARRGTDSKSSSNDIETGITDLFLAAAVRVVGRRRRRG